jgi:SAM-dependent methyltransferase
LYRALPYPVRLLLTRWREQRTQQKYARLSLADTFDRIYNSHAWGVSEDGSLYSGDGSDKQVVAEYLPTIADVLRSRGIDSVADLGCGNFNTGRMIAAVVPSYIGVDVADPVITANNRNYAKEGVRFVRADLTCDPLPAAGAALVRQVLQHLSNEEIRMALLNILRTYPVVIITEHLYVGPGFRPNLDIAHGPGTRVPLKSGVFIDQPPFGVNASVVGDLRCGEGGTESLRTWVFENVH